MAGLTFLFSAALWGLPLAGLPVLLHLLFRRKSPVMQFSTIRFIKASVQHTAARKRVRRWLLLACRAILLALLIAAVAQPAKILATGWTKSGNAAIAAVVVDTSYSMQLQEKRQPLLASADAMVRDLLGDQLREAKVALFRSPPPESGHPEQLRRASEILSQWTPLAPQGNPRPLVDRVAAAVDLLDREHADDKWLVVFSDFQKREFPSQMPQSKSGRMVLIDLHAERPRSAGIAKVAIEPAQPTPGIGSEAVVDVVGEPNTTRPVTVTVSNTAGAKLLDSGVQVANLDAAGRARLRFPVRLPAQRWMLLTATLQGEDDMSWDNTRSQLIETPPRQIVSFLGNPAPGTMQRAVWLALDPAEGSRPEGWSLQVRQANDVAPDANVAVLIADEWPDDARTARLLAFARGGGTIIWFIRPGLEETWAALPANRRAALAQMLPSEPVRSTVAPVSAVSVAAPQEPLLAGFADDRFQIHSIVVRRLVPFIGDPAATLLLNSFPQDPKPGVRPHGLLYRRAVGAGTVFTFATLPDRQFTNLPLHPLFLPLLVRMAQRPPARGDAQNIELGQPLVLSGRQFEGLSALTVQGPQGDLTAVNAVRENGSPSFAAGPAQTPGLYTWLKPSGSEPLAITNVQLPAAESELFFSPAQTLIPPADNVIVARSVAELQSHVASLGEPEPHWTLPIAIVLLLLCLEALMASMSKLWRPIGLGAWLPRMRGQSPRSMS
ncbi:MAG: hypothetical protein JWP03_2314 [Phycisphaerales bacterium]|nr:hypothetical protein [Phycisphaerales bacterium]